MIFNHTTIDGVYLIDLQKREDDRGFLVRTWDEEDFKKNGNDFHIVESYLTKSLKKGTIRGFHFLTVPEQKVTKVMRGAVYEVVIDVRPESKTFRKWEAFNLKDTDFKMLYMNPGIAHAILALEDDTELLSQYSPAYAPGNEGGIRYNDPQFAIKWPIAIQHVSVKDASWMDFK